MLVDLLPCNSDCALHVAGVVVCVSNLASDVNDVILIPGITITVVVPTVFDVFPYLGFSCCLICCPYVLQTFEASSIRKIIFYFSCLNVPLKEHIC